MKVLLLIFIVLSVACSSEEVRHSLDTEDFEVPSPDTTISSNPISVNWQGGPSSLEEMVEESVLIIQGIPQHTYFAPENIIGQPMGNQSGAYTEIEVTEVFEGEVNTGEKILVSEPYGMQAGTIFPAGNYVPLEYGEEYTLFLNQIPYDIDAIIEDTDHEVNEDKLQLIEESYELTRREYSVFHPTKESHLGENFWEIDQLEVLEDYYTYVYISEWEESEYEYLQERVFEEFPHE